MLPARRRVPILVLLLAVIATGTSAACGDDPERSTATTATTATSAATAATGATAATTAAGAGDAAVDPGVLGFTARTVAGEPVDAATFAGRDVVVWFWSPWCGSCNREADGVGRVAAELGGEAVFLGIAGNATQDEYEAFLEEHDLSAFPQLVDDTGEVWLRFGADVIRSSFFFLDDTGEVSQTGYGQIDEGELRDRVAAMIAS